LARAERRRVVHFEGEGGDMATSVFDKFVFCMKIKGLQKI
jgi:diphthamide synthase (EF-2-diphthine--ammonia ligase)